MRHIMNEEGIIKVVVAPHRTLKRGGRYYEPGATLEIPQAEYDTAPAGLYIVPGTVADPVEVAKQEKQRRDDEDRKDKLRRMEEDQKRREEAAARTARQLEEQAQLAKAASVRLQQNNRKRAAG